MLKAVTNLPTIEIKFAGDVNINNDMDVDEFNRRVSTAIVQTVYRRILALGANVRKFIVDRSDWITFNR